jgi:hypothetical protein
MPFEQGTKSVKDAYLEGPYICFCGFETFTQQDTIRSWRLKHTKQSRKRSDLLPRTIACTRCTGRSRYLVDHTNGTRHKETSGQDQASTLDDKAIWNQERKMSTLRSIDGINASVDTLNDLLQT